MQRGKIHGQSSEKGFFSREQCTKKSALHTYGFACRNRTLPCRKKDILSQRKRSFFLFFSRRFLSLTSSSSYFAFFPLLLPGRETKTPRGTFSHKNRVGQMSLCVVPLPYFVMPTKRERERERRDNNSFVSKHKLQSELITSLCHAQSMSASFVLQVASPAK